MNKTHKSSKVYVFAAQGLEEIECLTQVDLLRRGGVEVVLTAVGGNQTITGSHEIVMQADARIEDVDLSDADALVLPGGMPGTTHLGENSIVCKQCTAFAADKYVAAICAAPSVLAGLGLLVGKHATCHPAVEEKLSGAIVTGEPVTVDGNIITGQGLGAGIPFALKLVEILTGKETADRIAAAICAK